MLRVLVCSYFGFPGWASGGFDNLTVKHILGDGGREAKGLGEMLLEVELWPGFSISVGLGEEGSVKGMGSSLVCARGRWARQAVLETVAGLQS